MKNPCTFTRKELITAIINKQPIQSHETDKKQAYVWADDLTADEIVIFAAEFGINVETDGVNFKILEG